VIEPNRLSTPGERAARRRVEAIFERIDALTAADLDLIAARPPDPDLRDDLLAGLEDAADRHGRGELLEEARSAVRDELFRRISATFPSDRITGGTLPGPSTDDIAGLVLVLQDLVAVAVTEDFLAPDPAATLAEPGRELLGLAEPAMDDGGPSAPEAGHDARWAPSAADWAAADEGRTTVDPDVPMPGIRGMWVGFVTVTGVVGVVGALAYGLASDQLLLGALVAAAVAALWWTFATFRRAA
jgi:hypothetical protein